MNGTHGHILIIKLGALGDFIQALGPMAAIRRHHRHDHITLLTTAPYVEMGRSCGYVDDVWVDARPKWNDIKGWLDLRKQLNNGKFARVYDLQNNDRTAFYLKLFRKKPEWVGAAPGASHRNTSPERNAGKAFDGHVQTLSLAGVTGVQIDRLDWMMGPGPFDGLRQPYILIVPGSAANRPEKRWPVNHYRSLCRNLIEHGFQPVLLGSDAEKETLAAIADNLPGVVNFGGQTVLFDIASLSRGAAGAIGNDTGPMHIIAATGCPTIVLFSGHSQPHRHAPKGRDVVTLQKNDLSELRPEMVWQAFARQLSAPS